MNIDYIIVGVDVGGTHTDAVLMQGNKVLAYDKTITTSDITHGIEKVIRTLFERCPQFKDQVHSVNIGTTHLVNALVQGKGFNKTLVVRLAAPLTDALPPTVDWSEEAKKNQGKYLDKCLIIKGGYEYKAKDTSGEPKEVSPLDCDALQKEAQETLTSGTQAVAITGLFSTLNNQEAHEEKARAIFKEVNPSLEVSLSHTFEGYDGLLLRENATILSACISRLHKHILEAYKRAVQELHISTKNVFLTLGNGTKRKIDATTITPLLTLDSGPANSAKGAAFLAKLENAVTVDVGGTSTDFGIYRKGMPQNETSVFQRGGINLNFTSFRFRSYSLGGGTRITFGPSGEIILGPDSIGNGQHEKSLIYGGHVLTPTDIAFLLGRIKPDGEHHSIAFVQEALHHLFPSRDLRPLVTLVDEAIHQKLIADAADFLNGLENIPPHLVLVGGGSKLFNLERLKTDPRLAKFELIIPEHAEIANAIGAAKSWIGATYTGIYSLAKQKFYDVERNAFEMAKKKAVLEGADEATVRQIDLEQIPLSYLPGCLTQIRVTVIGDDRGISTEKLEAIRHKVTEAKSSVALRAPSKITNMAAPQARRRMEGVRALTKEEVEDIARGSGLLGSGGGGDTAIARLMTTNAIQSGKVVNTISLEKLPDDARVVVVVGVGSPFVLYERLFTSHEGINVLQTLEAKIGKVDAVISGECGGTNAIYPLFISSNADVPVVDADCAGRCLPELQMMLPNIYGEIKDTPFALSNGLNEAMDVATDLWDLEKRARTMIVDMGGVVSMAIVPMTGSEVKNWTIKGTFSLLQKMGAALRENEKGSFAEKLDALNKVLCQTEYKMARKIGEGKICGLQRTEINGFSTGGFLVKNLEKPEEIIEIGFQNENIVARQRKGEKPILAQVPHLITIVEMDTFNIISCEKLKDGLVVGVLSLTAPEKLCTEKAMKVVGPAAYPFDEILKFLDSLKENDTSK